MKHFIQLLFILALLAANTANAFSSSSELEKALPKGISFVEAKERKGEELIIPYKKFRLENGLTVILHEDHSDPLVHVDVTYHVGSAREEPGKSGFAHFFEHMMFQGSENVADEQHFKMVSEAGGVMNGTTNSDRTNYFQTVPVNQLEKMLWLEADRMGFLLDAVTQEKFENQRETVKNERGQRIDNVPYGRLGERISEALFPEGHPYSWPVIGFIEDLNRVNVNDLKKFFLRWYGPNNATLTIGGDIDVPETLKLVNKYFGSIPKGPEVENLPKEPVKLDSLRRISMEDNVHLPLVSYTYPTVHRYHEDEAPLDVLMEIMGVGKTSLLYKNLVKPQLAVQAWASHGCAELSCQFGVGALPHPASGKSLAEIEEVIKKTFEEFEKRGVTDDDLEKIKAKLESRFVFGLQSVRGKVSKLAEYEFLTGDPSYIKKEYKAYTSVTKKDVERVYKKYIKNAFPVVMSVVPLGKLDMVAKPDNFEPPVRKFVEKSETSADDLKVRVAKDDFDRSKVPEAGPNPLPQVPSLWTTKLENEVEVLGNKNTETPTSSILLKIPGGHYHNSPEKAGLGWLTAALLNESTSKRSAEEITLALEKLGSTISIGVDDYHITVFVNSLTKNLDETLDILLEKITQPGFEESDFKRLQAQLIEQIKNGKKNPGSLARNAYTKLLYGNSIAGLPVEGTVSTVSKLAVDDVKGFYNLAMKPAGTELTVVSDLEQKDVLKALKKLTAWKGKAQLPAFKYPESDIDTKFVYMVDKEDAAQAVIRIGKRAIPRDFTGEFFKATLMNYNLGGAFNSRINLNLREDKGYTYGARSYFWGDQFDGGFSAGASVRADVADASFVEFRKEITNYYDKGMTKDELVSMKLAVGQRDALEYETPNSKLGFMANILEYDLPHDFVKEQAKIIKDSNIPQLNALAKKHLDFDSMLKLVVGDTKTLKPAFEKLGYEVKEVTVD